MLALSVRRVQYDDQDTEWINVIRDSNRVLVDDQILSITDKMKIHLGIPLDGFKNAVGEASVVRYASLSCQCC